MKRIDHFHFAHNNSESSLVDVDLQRMPFQDVKHLHTLHPDYVAEILGRPPANSVRAVQPPQPFIRRQILAGYLGLIKVGDLVEAGRRIAKLPTQRAKITVSSSNPPIDITLEDRRRELNRPKDWNSKYPYHALNKFEYLLPTEFDERVTNPNLSISNTRCLIIQYGKVEYVLPKIVIFQSYYCLSSKFINALCNKPWKKAAEDVISFDKYESGIGTRIDEETGAWNLVLRTGVDFEFGRILALFLFDPFANACITSLYSQSVIDNQARNSSHGRGWLASANIPHQVSDFPLTLVVEGYFLRKFRPSFNEADIRRFLITSIVGSSWPLQNQIIRIELHNSNLRGETQTADPMDRPYRSGKAPVEGSDDAIATSDEDPNAASAINEFRRTQFTYIDAPPLQRQVKNSSKIYASADAVRSDGASLEVSAGTPLHGSDRPAKAEVIKSERDPSEQFSFLVRFLERLCKYRVIDSYACCGPDDPNYLVERNGLACWTLVSSRFIKSKKLPRTGWEIVKMPKHGSAIVGKPSYTRHARSVLIISIRISGTTIVLFEVEPRPSETSAYKLVAFQLQRPLDTAWVVPVLDGIRKCEGIFDEKEIGHVFSSLTSDIPSTRKHSYRTVLDESTNKRVVCDLNDNALGHWLLSVAETAGAETTSRAFRLNRYTS